jgi:hypothetical protein
VGVAGSGPDPVLDEDEEVADEIGVVGEPKPVPPDDGAAPGSLFVDAVPLARREFDELDVADMVVERLMRLSEDVVVVGVIMSDGLESVTTVPFKNEIFRVDVDVSVTVLSEVFVAEEL